MVSDIPLVTIGAINYNNGKYVLETLESINAQTYSNIELVIVDDCSTDDSIEIIDNWLINYNKPYRFIKHEKNLGVCATCNDVLKYTNGRYFSLIATDDIMLPDKISVQVSILEQSNNSVCAVYSDAYLMKEDSSPRYGWFIQKYKDFENVPSGNIYDDLLVTNFIPAMSALVKTNCYREVGNFDENLSYEDYDMWLRFAKKYEFIYSDFVSVKYRVRFNSLSGKTKNWDILNVAMFAKHLPHPLALKKLEKIAENFYLCKDQEGLKSLKSYRKHSSYLSKIIIISQLFIPRFLGWRLLTRFRNA